MTNCPNRDSVATFDHFEISRRYRGKLTLEDCVYLPQRKLLH